MRYSAIRSRIPVWRRRLPTPVWRGRLTSAAGRLARLRRARARAPSVASAWVPVAGLRVHTWLGGLENTHRLPIVLIHGLVSGRHMLPLAARLIEEYCVYAPDLPGFGKSDRPPRALDVPGLADALADWHWALGLSRSNLVGNSLGCQVVADFAARYPEIVNRVVLIGPTVDPLARSLLNQAVRQVIERPREPLSLTTVTLPDYYRAGLLRMLRMARYAVADRIEEKLPRIQAPTLIIRGSRDPISPQRWVEQAVRLLPNGRLVVIPGAPHSTQYSHPDAVAPLIRDFFEAVEESAGAPAGSSNVPPDAVPDAVPDTAPDTASDAVPDPVPERTA